jgi:hypothetical protein
MSYPIRAADGMLRKAEPNAPLSTLTQKLKQKVSAEKSVAIRDLSSSFTEGMALFRGRIATVETRILHRISVEPTSMFGGGVSIRRSVLGSI